VSNRPIYFALFICCAVTLVARSEAQTFNFTTGTQSWNVNSNWTPSGFPNATGASATFNSPTGTQTVNLSAAITVGSISITNNGSNNLTLANGTGGSLTMDAAGAGPATISYSGTNSGTNNVTISASVILTDSLTYTTSNVAGTGVSTSTFTGTITGSGGFTKAGPGRLSMTTVAKAYTGATVVDQGRFRMTSAGQLTGTSSILVNSGGSLYLDSNSGTWSFGSSAASTTVTINGDGDNGGGAGTQGALRNQGSGTNTFANPLALGSAATIHTDGSSILQLNGGLSGSATLTKSGGGTLQLTTANPSFSGGASVTNGTILVDAASNLGTGALEFAQSAGNNTSVTLNNATQSISSLSSIWTDTSGTRTQTLTLNGTALTVNQSGASTFGTGSVATLTSVIAGAGSVTKQGAGSLTLGSTNTYTGGTTVSAGTLLANGAVSGANSATGTGGVTVGGGASAATLGGTGGVSGTVTVNNNGTLAPGASIESLDTGSLVFNAGSTFSYEFNSALAAGTPAEQAVSADVVNILGSGTLTINNDVQLTFDDVATSEMVIPLGTKFTLIRYAVGGLLGAAQKFVGYDEGHVFSVGSNTFQISYNDLAGPGINFTTDVDAGAYVTITSVAAIPEASAFWFGAAVCGLAAAWRRWPRKKPQVVVE
jgi:autotransporter-associated beta strand protein